LNNEFQKETRKPCPNRLKPSGNYIYHPIQHKKLCILLRIVFVSYIIFTIKHRKIPETA